MNRLEDIEHEYYEDDLLDKAIKWISCTKIFKKISETRFGKAIRNKTEKFREPEDLRSCKEKIEDAHVKLPDGLEECIVYVVENNKILAITKEEIKYIHKLVMAGAITALRVTDTKIFSNSEELWRYRIYA